MTDMADEGVPFFHATFPYGADDYLEMTQLLLENKRSAGEDKGEPVTSALPAEAKRATSYTFITKETKMSLACIGLGLSSMLSINALFTEMFFLVAAFGPWYMRGLKNHALLYSLQIILPILITLIIVTAWLSNWIERTVDRAVENKDVGVLKGFFSGSLASPLMLARLYSIQKACITKINSLYTEAPDEVEIMQFAVNQGITHGLPDHFELARLLSRDSDTVSTRVAWWWVAARGSADFVRAAFFMNPDPAARRAFFSYLELLQQKRYSDTVTESQGSVLLERWDFLVKAFCEYEAGHRDGVIDAVLGEHLLLDLIPIEKSYEDACIPKILLGILNTLDTFPADDPSKRRLKDLVGDLLISHCSPEWQDDSRSRAYIAECLFDTGYPDPPKQEAKKPQKNPQSVAKHLIDFYSATCPASDQESQPLLFELYIRLLEVSRFLPADTRRPASLAKMIDALRQMSVMEQAPSSDAIRRAITQHQQEILDTVPPQAREGLWDEISALFEKIAALGPSPVAQLTQ